MKIIKIIGCYECVYKKEFIPRYYCKALTQLKEISVEITEYVLRRRKDDSNNIHPDCELDDYVNKK